MAQYCKYCSFCIEGDCFYCTAKEEMLGEKQIHYTNKCKEYEESEMGSIIDGRRYKPRRKRNTNFGQDTLDDIKSWEDNRKE